MSYVSSYILDGYIASIAIQRAMRFLNKDFKRDYNQNAAYLMGIGLRDISGWYDLPWKVRQRRLSGTKGIMTTSPHSIRQSKRANQSRAGKKNRMASWRSRICYKGIYMPRTIAIPKPDKPRRPAIETPPAGG